jgi:hypothetical protein
MYTAPYTAHGLEVLDADLRRLAQHSGAYPFHFVSGSVKVAPRGRGTKKPIKKTVPASEAIIQTFERQFLLYNQGACVSATNDPLPDPTSFVPSDFPVYSDERAGREYMRKPVPRARFFRRS